MTATRPKRDKAPPPSVEHEQKQKKTHIKKYL
jgi:hypothetical protein